MSTAIRLERVSKRFALRQRRAQSFQDLVVGLFRRKDQVPVDLQAGSNGDLWALRDVSFSVEEGETIGVIGSNGAGKSTLLKLISRIIEPTSGEIEVNGRVGALLELGAGFHPDLTGRENIYLNGSILGLSRAEIKEKEAQIIAFAELERFIDMPVKHYSSGMHMRLGFSVAVHTDPKILLVDEVLAVGDENFQHKCLDRITGLRREGITICFVSHGLGQVRRLCSRALWLDRGAIQADGEVQDVVTAYLRQAAIEEDSRMGEAGRAAQGVSRGARTSHQKPVEASRRDSLEVVGVSLLDETGRERQVFQVGEPWTVRLAYRSSGITRNPVFRLAVARNDGLHVCALDTRSAGFNIPYLQGEGELFYRLDQLPLMEGTYLVSASGPSEAEGITGDERHRLHAFKVRQVENGERYGLVSLGGRWTWNTSGIAPVAAPASQGLIGREGGREGPSDPERRWGTGEIRVVNVSFVDAAGMPRRVFEAGEPWVVRLRYQADREIENPVFGLAVHRTDGVHICGPNSRFGGLSIPSIEGPGEVLYAVDSLPLMEGEYHLSVSAHNRADTVMYDYHDRLYPFRVCRFNDAQDQGIASLGGHWAWEG